MGTGERAIHNPFADDGGDKAGKPAMPAPPVMPPPKKGKGKAILFTGLGVVLLAGLAAAYFFFFRKDLRDIIIIPYIAHQPPRVDPHVPGQSDLSDKLDELLFDGLFNVAATPSGISYEDGLGELMGIDGNKVVSLRLRPGKRWHSSFSVRMEKDKIASIDEKEAVKFVAEDLRFSLRRISALGSVSPDFILVSQAVKDFDFSGPDENHEIRFQFRGDRMWTEADIKEVLSFKVLPASSGMNETQYSTGTGPYLQAGEFESSIFFHKNPDQKANVTRVLLRPFIDNSTYTTELRNRNINVLPSTPFGAASPVLGDGKNYFHKSSISTCYFALLYNVQRLNREQRHALRALIDRKKIVDRFFKLGTAQQRNIANYKGAGNNFEDYVNYSVFPSTSYYVEENVVTPLKEFPAANLSVLPDTVRIYTNINQGYKEELSEIAGILNDPSVFGGRIKVNAASDQDIARGDYDAVLVPVSGYRSNFLFDLYDVFLREPSFAVKKIHLETRVNEKNERVADARSFQKGKNFFGLDLAGSSADRADTEKLLEYVYGFMASSEIGDKQAYAQYLDELDKEMALGSWLFSLPSLAYFSTQFESSSIHLYGIASQLSTIEKWQEKTK